MFSIRTLLCLCSSYQTLPHGKVSIAIHFHCFIVSFQREMFINKSIVIGIRWKKTEKIKLFHFEGVKDVSSETFVPRFVAFRLENQRLWHQQQPKNQTKTKEEKYISVFRWSFFTISFSIIFISISMFYSHVTCKLKSWTCSTFRITLVSLFIHFLFCCDENQKAFAWKWRNSSLFVH